MQIGCASSTRQESRFTTTATARTRPRLQVGSRVWGAVLWPAWGAVERGLRSRAASLMSMSIYGCACLYFRSCPSLPLFSLYATLVPGSCCDRKHFWEGLEYDNYPVVFNLSLNCPTHYDASGKPRPHAMHLKPRHHYKMRGIVSLTCHTNRVIRIRIRMGAGVVDIEPEPSVRHPMKA